jgi:hypothetical protein
VLAELFERQESGEKNFVHTSPETLFAVDLDDRNALVIALTECRIGVDIHQLRFEAVTAKESQRVVAKVTTLTCIENELGHDAPAT